MYTQPKKELSLYMLHILRKSTSKALFDILEKGGLPIMLKCAKFRFFFAKVRFNLKTFYFSLNMQEIIAKAYFYVKQSGLF